MKLKAQDLLDPSSPTHLNQKKMFCHLVSGLLDSSHKLRD